MFDARKRILDELSSILSRTQGFERHLRNADGRIPEVREDWVELLEDDEVIEALDEAGLRRVGLLLAALDRVDKGTYGISVKSGAPIDERRLMALPEATLTAEEAREAEANGEEVVPPIRARASRDKAVQLDPAGGEEMGESPGPTGSRDTRTTIPADERSQPEDAPSSNRPDEIVEDLEGTSSPGELIGS
jgi:DnaK suppressor protein